MKQDSDELFQLISGLTLSEKRYCALYLTKHSASGNRYLRLYNVLNAQQAYDGESALRAIELKKKPAHYAVLKKQLYEQLLNALHQFDLFTNPEQQLFRSIHQCHLLLQKGLLKQCQKRMASLEQTAQRMNHREALLQLQQLKMLLKARSYYRHESEENLENWLKETQHVVSELEVISNFRYLSSRVYKMQYDSGVRGKELAERMKTIVHLPEFSHERKSTPLPARLDFLQVRALFHFTNLETEKAFSYNEKFLHLLDANPLLLQLHADRYFSVLNNFLIDCLVLKRYEMLETGLARMRGLSKIPAFRRLANFEANVFRLGYLLEMNHYISLGRFAAAYQNLQPIIAGLKKFGERIVKHNRITLQYLMAYTCFILGKYDEALDHLRVILQEKETAVAENVQHAARMLQLLCHFEKREFLLVEGLVKSLRRYVKRDAATEIPHVVISFIQAAARKPGLDKKQWTKLQLKVEQLAKDKASAASMNLFNYVAWIRSHLSGKPVAEVWQ